MKTSDVLTEGELYSRAELRDRFSVTDQTINTGIFHPPGHDSVWLFITRDKESDMTPYEDRLDGDTLHWQGQTSGAKDVLIIEHEARGLELLVFYRESKREHDDYAFRYEGPFAYQNHSGSGPATFTLTRARAPSAGTSGRAPSAEGGEAPAVELRTGGSTPCLVDVLAGLQQSSKESVVADGRLTALQEKMHVADKIEDWVAARISAWRDAGRQTPLLVVLSGNAGDGKSELIERLRKRPSVTGEDLKVIADATHAESPSQSQADRLVDALDPFASPPAVRHETPPCVLIAINVGMVIAFFAALEERGDAERFSELRDVLHSRLGLARMLPPEPTAWACEVINLDHRNILGLAGRGLFDGMLNRLDPEAEEGITYDAAQRCSACPVRASCWVRTNLNLLRLEPVREHLRDLLWKVSLAEDLHLSPRNVWDFLYHAITGGPRISEQAFLSCEWLMEELPDHAGELTGELLSLVHRRLLYHSIFEPPVAAADPANAILEGLSKADPIRSSGRLTHIAEGNVRADPRVDAALLGQLSADATELAAEGPRPDPLLEALAALTETLELWQGPNDGNGRDLAYGVPRRARITGTPAAVHEEVTDITAREFRMLLEVYGRWTPGTDAPAEIEALWTDVLIRGVQAIFGLPLQGQAYFRLDTLSPTTRYPAYVPVDLRKSLRVEPDPALDGRASALPALGYIPRALSASVHSGAEEPWSVPIDLQLYRLLRQVNRGYAASSVDLQAFFRLRYACERLGTSDDATEIVFRSVISGQSFRIRREDRLTGATTTFMQIGT